MRRNNITFILALFGVLIFFVWGLPPGHHPSTPMLKGLNGWHAKTLFTVGESVPSNDHRTPNQQYQPAGVPDGMGAYSPNNNTLRVFLNHELTKESGYEYSLVNGTILTGARISFFDIDQTSLTIVDGGLAYHTIHDRQGHTVIHPSQINEIDDARFGLSRLCSSQLVQAGTYNFVDRIYFTGEEIVDPVYHPYGGTLWALDVQTSTLHAVPAVGRMSFENVATLQADKKNRVAFLIGDDSPPQSQEPHRIAHIADSTTPVDKIVSAPLWLYLGQINAATANLTRHHLDVAPLPSQAFLNRNGLLIGDLFYFVADHDIRTVAQFNGTGTVITGSWKGVSVRDITQAGQPGHDAYGYKNGFTLRGEAKAGGAFQFSRPEDFSPHPVDGSRVVFASTGRDSVYPGDAWGTIYEVKVDIQQMRATLRILYDGDDQGGGLFPHPDDGIRNPDNLVWASDGNIYVQEAMAKSEKPLFGSHSHQEASIWRLAPHSMQVDRIAQIDRATGGGSRNDRSPSLIGAWESSGILDVSQWLAHEENERVLLATIQAHSLNNFQIEKNNLVENGQLILLHNRPFKE